MRLKDGVRVTGLEPEALLAIQVSRAVYESFGYEVIITSITDGRHSNGSFHHTGHAFDLRIRHLPEGEPERISRELSERLGQNYDVVLEDTHIHIEHDPR